MGSCLCKDKKKKHLIQASSIDEEKVQQIIEMLKKNEIQNPQVYLKFVFICYNSH
jgi:predicted transcriptional regulator